MSDFPRDFAPYDSAGFSPAVSGQWIRSTPGIPGGNVVWNAFFGPNTLVMSPCFARSVDRFGTNIAVAGDPGTVLRFVCAAHDYATGYPGDVLGQSTAASDVTGIIEASLPSPIPSPGILWVGAVAQGAGLSPTVTTMAGLGQVGGVTARLSNSAFSGAFYGGISGAVGDTLPAPGGTFLTLPLLGVRVG